MRRRYRKPTHRVSRAAPCPDPLRRRGRGSCGRGAGTGRADRGLARAGRGHRHRRPRRDGTACCAPWSRTAIACSCASCRGPTRSCTGCSSTSRRFAGLARRLLYLFGSRPLARHIAEHDPDVIVSTYPGRDRGAGAAAAHQSRALPDGGDDHRSHGPVLLGAAGDRHAPGDVRRVAALGRADRRAGQRAPGASADIRRFPRPALPAAGASRAGPARGGPDGGRLRRRLGGGGHRGRRARAQRAAGGEQHRLPGGTQRAARGQAERAPSRRSHACTCYGFTDKMPQLLAAADVLVHSTGGVTCLEAKAAGTPVVSYGLPVGHARLNTRAMADARPAAPGQQHRRAARARPGELRRGRRHDRRPPPDAAEGSWRSCW